MFVSPIRFALRAALLTLAINFILRKFGDTPAQRR